MITAVTTCMGRRHHLETTLPLMLEAFDGVIVVDWSCPQASGEWAAKEGAQVIYQKGATRFSCSAARNLGAFAVETEYVAFIDADGFCLPGFKEDLESLVSLDSMVLSSRTANGSDVCDTNGFIVCSIEKFRSVGGYDVSFVGWGHEDFKLRAQLALEAKLSVKRLNPSSLGAIRHSMAERCAYLPLPIEESAKTNNAKLQDYLAQFGVTDWLTDPRTESFAFRNPDGIR